MGVLSYSNNKEVKVQSWVIICYGNILRSQVLEQYLRYYSKKGNIKIKLHSAGVAKLEEFPNTKELLSEIYQELTKRNIPSSLKRNTWSKDIEQKIITADIILVADNKIKTSVIEKMNNQINKEKIYTFYEIILEGEIDFQDTYDYKKKKQNPQRFKAAFNELDRISKKILSNL